MTDAIACAGPRRARRKTMGDLPRELHPKAEGFTERMVMHLNMGRAGHQAVFDIFAPDGSPLPIQRAYRTGKDPMQGFFLRGSAEPMTWAELVRAWPAYLRVIDRLRAKGLEIKDALEHMRHDNPMTMIVIYDRPKDRPDGFVVREWIITPGSVVPARVLGENLATIEAARELVPAGLVNIGRQPDDDAKIAEVWT
jgi:hypothetical protein